MKTKIGKKVLSIIVILFMLFTTIIPTGFTEEAYAIVSGSVPKQRYSHPSRNNSSDYKYYYANNNNGFPLNSIDGNCTWYAWGRGYEYTGKKLQSFKGDACKWYSQWKGEKGKEPRPGAIACWSYGNSSVDGHVAFVEKVKSNGDFICSNSGWRGVNFFRNTLYKSNGYKLAWNSGSIFQGFLYLNTCSHKWDDGGKYYGKCRKGCGTWYQDVDGFSTAAKNKVYTYKAATNIKVYPHASAVTAKNNANITGKANVVGVKGDWYKVKVKYASDVSYGYVLKTAVKEETAASTLEVTTSGFTIKQGSKHTISGTVKSNYAITKITGKLGSQTKTLTTADFGKSTYNFKVAGSKLDSVLKCGSLSAGTHSLQITAWDASGAKKSASATVTVNGGVKTPAVSKVEDAAGGKKVTFKQNESGATLWYKIGSQAWKSTTQTTFTYPTIITAEGKTKVSAYSKKGSTTSATITKDITVTKLEEPSAAGKQAGKLMKVTLTAKSGASIMYRKGTSGNFSAYNGSVLSLNDGDVITYYAKKNGFINSKVGEYQAKLGEPGKPDAKLMDAESTVATGKTVTIGWKKDERATSYTAILYDASDDSIVEEQEVTEPTVSFKLSKAGTYYVLVTASNDIGESDASSKVTVTAKDPLTVTFRDAGNDEEPGAVLNTFTVEYGSKLSQVDAPSRKGHTFAGWENTADGTVSQNAYLKAAVKEDLTYAATYEQKSYKVRIYDQDGDLLATKTVKYGEALDTSNEENAVNTKLEPGHVFAGWQVTETAESDSEANINSVDSDMEVHAVVSWAEPELPVQIELSDTRQGTAGDAGSEYITSTVRLYNDRSEDLSMYLIYVLKSTDSDTGAEKTIYSDRRIVELPAGNGSSDPEKTIGLRMKPEDISQVTDLEVVAVRRNPDMTTGSTYSAIAHDTVNITSEYGAWSDWSSTEYAASEDRQVEKRYRSREKAYTYNGNDTLSGYTKESTEYYNYSTGKWQSGSYTYTATGYVVTAPEKTTNITASYKDVKSYVTTTAQRSYAYVSGKKDWYWTGTGGTSPSGQKTSNLLTVYSSKSLAGSGYSKDTDGSYALPKTISTSSPGKMGTIYRIDYAGTASANTFTSGTKNTWLWPHSSKTRTLYRATTVRSRNKFWKWGNWSDWGSESITATAAKQVEMQCRYRDRQESGKTDIKVNGKAYPFDGVLDVETDLTGKKATIMVFQSHNTDPNKYQMQYVGQTEIKAKEDGTKNYYEFSVIPKKEPTSETGNYIVALSVQGSTGLIQVGMIKAPQDEYDVELYYEDAAGNEHVIAKDLKVKEHESIDLSGVEVPELEGYMFLGWENRTTDITSDCITEIVEDENVRKVCRIKAVYAPLQNAVVFVDWINQTIEINNAKTGEVIEVPETVPSAEGYEFRNWKLEDGTAIEGDPATVTVTGNMVITAEYTPIEYTVRFIGVNNEVVDEQTVRYGEAAEPPAYTAPEGKGTFVSWSTEKNWWSVEGDVDVRAIVVYDEQAEKPEAEVLVDEETEARTLALETEDSGDIFYTLDGTLPTDELIQDYLNSDADTYKGSIQKYTAPIAFTEPEEGEEEVTVMDVVAVTYAEGKNTSDGCYVYFEKDPEASDEIYADGEWTTVGEYEVKASAGKDVQINVALEENPGLTGYDFLIESDDGVFYTDQDEYGEPVATGGELSENGTLTASDVSGGWRVSWNAMEANSGDGNLFTMKLHSGDETEDGIYPITVSYAPANTYDEDFVNTELSNVKVTVDSEASIKLDTLDISLSRTTFVYEGEAIEPSVKAEGLKEGEDYTVEYEDNVDVGTAKAVITGMGDYAGTVEKEFTITQANIANADVGEIADVVKTGEAIEPELTVSYNDTPLEKDKDYEVTFADNVEVGTATASIKGIGNFKGTTEAQFNITETTESKLAEAEKKLAEAEARIAELQAAKEAAETAQAEAEEAKRQAEADLADANEALAQAKDEAEAEALARAAAEAQLTAAKAAQAAAEAEANTAKAAQAEAEARAEAAEAAQESLEEELRTAKNEKEAAEAQAALDRAAKETAEAQLAAAQAAQATAEANEQAAIRAKEAAELQAENAQNKLAQAEAEIEAANAAKEAAEAEAEANAQAKEEAEQRLAEAIEAKTAAEAELKEAEDAKKEAETKLADAEKEKAAAAAKVEELTKAKEAAEKRAEEAEKALAEANKGGTGNGANAQQAQAGTAQNAEIVDLPAVKIRAPKAAKKAAAVKWKKVSAKNRKKISKIQIQYSMDKTFTRGVKTKTAKKTAVSKKIKKLKSRKTYYVRIRAYKKIGTQIHVSNWSKVKKVKVK